MSDLAIAWGMFFGLWLVLELYSITTQAITGLITGKSIENRGDISEAAPQA